MKKRIAFWLAAALALCLGACQTQPAGPYDTPMPSETATPAAEVTPAPVPTPEPTPAETVPASPGPLDTSPWPDVFVSLNALDLSSYEEELSPEEWEALQGFFPVLNNEVPMLAAHMPYSSESVTPTEEVFFRDIYQAYAPQVDIPADRQSVSAFTLVPVVGDDLDLAFSFCPLGHWYLLIHREGEQFYAVYMPVRWFFLDATGLYSGSGGAAVAYYRRLHFADGTFTEELLANTDWGPYFAISGEEVTEAEFDAWLEENLSGDAVWYPARTRVEPWQEAYLDILLHPEEYEEFYAAAEYIPSNHTWIIEEMAIEDYNRHCFAVCDLNNNQTPELLLGCGMKNTMPRALLNILTYDEDSGQVKDFDGPRTYPLQDTLFFYDTGYFYSTKGVGNLYTESWRLEEEDPKYYWYGWDSIYYDGLYPFASSYGDEYTNAEYYEMIGDASLISVEWYDLTPENIQKAFLSTGGEKVAP